MKFKCFKTGEILDPDLCIKCSEEEVNQKLGCTLDPAILQAIKRMREEDRKGLSVTMLTGCLRKVVLLDLLDIPINPEKAYWMFRGQLAHAIVETTREPDVIKERRLWGEYKGVKFSGKFDWWNPKTGLLKDYKSTKQVVHKYSPVKAHVAQLNLYAELIRYNIADEGRTIRRMNETLPEEERWTEKEINALLNGKVTRAKIVQFDMETVSIKAVPLWTNRKVLEYLDETLVVLDEALKNNTLPPYKEIYLCNGYCEVNRRCRSIYRKELMDKKRIEKTQLEVK